MSTLPKGTSHAARTARPIPPLHNGDQLTRLEFERRYEAMPHIKKAELIEGEVHMPSPVRHEEHAQPHSRIGGWATVYVAYTPGVDTGNDATVRLDRVNEPQPDVHVRFRPGFGGQTKLSKDGYIEGAPEVVVEVSASSVSIDLNRKLKAYQRNGVREYLVWRVLDDAFDWFVLVDEELKPLAPTEAGILKSTVFPGLWLDAAALLRDDMPRVLAVLNEGIASPEHADFVATLASRRSPEA